MPPDAFASTWESRPSDPVVLGLRLISARDRIEIRRQAKEYADGQHRESDDWVECYNLACVRNYVALGICDPNDPNRGSDILPYPEVQVPFALTEAGARFIFDALIMNERERAVYYPAGTFDDVVDLTERIAAGELDELSETDREQALRHIRAALEILQDD